VASSSSVSRSRQRQGILRQAEVPEDAPDRLSVGDDREDAQASAALCAAEHVDLEGTLQERGPVDVCGRGKERAVV
jgi:hypothetical protein